VGDLIFSPFAFFASAICSALSFTSLTFSVIDHSIYNVEVTGAARLYRAATVWTAGLGI
jgi:uncharacterized membrane protein